MEGEGNERKFELSFSSEEPYERWFGIEILDHTEGCMKTERLSNIGCLLFNHNRDDVIGRVLEVRVEGNRGIAIVEVDDDSDPITQKVLAKMQSGTLKGVSVGYIINSFEEVKAGKQSVDGRFTGPCFVAKSWEPYEISIVTVPADPTVGVGRDLEEEDEPLVNVESKRSLDLFEKQLLINKNYFK